MAEDLSARRPGQNLRSNPYRTAAHDKGAEGEAYVGLLLERLPRQQWTVLHSVPVAGIGDVDHLVIGPPGVVAINTKNHAVHTVRVDGDAIQIGQFRVDYANIARRHRRVVANALAHAGAPEVAIHTVLAFVVDSAAHLTVHTPPAGVDVCWADDLPARLQAMPATASASTVEAVARIAGRPETWGTPNAPRRTGIVAASNRPPRGRPGRATRRRRGVRALVALGIGAAALLAVGIVGPFLGATATRDVDATAEPRTPALPEPPIFGYALYSDDPLARFLEASLARRFDQVSVSAWLDQGTVDAEVDRAIAEVSVRSPYVYIDGWERVGGTVIPHYRHEPYATQSQQIRAAMRIEEAADAIEAAGTDGPRAVVAAIHDRIAAVATFDESLAARHSDGTLEPDDFAPDAPSAFRPFGSVGLGYARAFAGVAGRLGIDAAVVTGEIDGMRHAWNVVDIDGERLVVDVALDDAVAGVGDERLLITAAEAEALGYVADELPRP